MERFLMHKEIDNAYQIALKLSDNSELLNLLAANNFEGVNYFGSKIANDLAGLKPEEDSEIMFRLDTFLTVNETAGVFSSIDCDILFDVNFSVMQQLFDIFIEEKTKFSVIVKVLEILAKFFSNKYIVNLVHDTQGFEGYIQILGRKLPLIGDFVCQLQLCECLILLTLNLTSVYWPRIWFTDSTIRSAFLSITAENFEEDARRALNIINRVEDYPRVFSYSVKSIMFGTYKLHHPEEQEFWVDFNYDSKSITFFFVNVDDPLWETARIESVVVKRYMIKDNKNENTQELIMTLDRPCYQTVYGSSEYPLTESNILTIVFYSFQKITDHVEKLYGNIDYIAANEASSNEVIVSEEDEDIDDCVKVCSNLVEKNGSLKAMVEEDRFQNETQVAELKNVNDDKGKEMKEREDFSCRTSKCLHAVPINMCLKPRRSALRARRKNKAMLNYIEDSVNDEKIFDFEFQSFRPQPKFKVYSKRSTSNKKHRSIFHTDTETISSGHSWLKNRKKMFETPKKKYSDRKRTKKVIPKVSIQDLKIPVIEEDSFHKVKSNISKNVLDQKQKVTNEGTSNELINKSKYSNWSDVENSELVIEKIPNRGCSVKRISMSSRSTNSKASVKHHMESEALEHDKYKKRLKYESDVDFEQSIEFTENSIVGVETKDSRPKSISKNISPEVNTEKTNKLCSNNVEQKLISTYKFKEEDLLPSPSKGNKIQLVRHVKEVEKSHESVSGRNLTENNFDSGIQISNMHTRTSLEEFDVACDESDGKEMHLKYFLNSLTENSDFIANESATSCTNNSRNPKKRESEGFNELKNRKKLKIDGQENSVLNHDVVKMSSILKSNTLDSNYVCKMDNKSNSKVKKHKIHQNNEVPLDDILLSGISETKSRNKKCHVPSSRESDIKCKKLVLKSPETFHEKKKEGYLRNSENDISACKASKRSSFPSLCSDQKSFKKMESRLLTLSQYANHYARKLIATFQIRSHEYYIKAVAMRKRITYAADCLLKFGESLPISDLKQIVKKCRFTYKKVETSLKKLRLVGQEYFEFEKEYGRKLHNQTRKAGAKYCLVSQETHKNISKTLEDRVASKLNGVCSKFLHEINEF